MRLAVWTIACVLACGACRRRHPAPPAPVIISADPSVSTSVAEPAASAATAPPAPSAWVLSAADVCGDYKQHLDATLHHALTSIGDAGLRYSPEHWTPKGLKDAIEAAGLRCKAFARGAWWVEPGSNVDLSQDLEISTRTTIRAVVDGRALDGWSPDGTGLYVGYGGMPTTMNNTILTDYDGDGIPELWVRTDEDGVEGGHFTSSWVLTVRDGKIVEYAPAKLLGEIGTPTDVDGDGRLDLPVTLGLGVVNGVCMGHGLVTPADLLAHSLSNGKFSTTDAVATDYAQKWCPAAPSRIASPKDALCARLWAAPADRASVRAGIAASCVPWDCPREAAGKPQKPGASQACNDMLDTFDQKTSFTLR